MIGVLSSDEVLLEISDFLGTEVIKYPLTTPESVWDCMLGASVAHLDITIMCSADGYSVEVRDETVSDTKMGCDNVEEILIFLSGHILKCLNIRISNLKTVEARIRFRETLLLQRQE